VLTFDDSSPGQFHRFATGGIDPRSAVGVLSAFARKHPRFRPTATLFLNAHPFADPDTAGALRYLTRAGYELGNHTMDHLNLSKVSSWTAQQDIVELQNLVTGILPRTPPVTFALPFGAWPADHSIVMAGATPAGSYRHEGVVLAGWRPAPSPFASDWDPTAIPRMCSTSWAGGTQAYYANWWLDTLSKNPGQRYVSAGRRGVVTYPRAAGPMLDPRFARYARPYDV
jgi:peptidoglycan/xylan/chitin deacetylase (PgdA/CDA1 family)